MPVQTLAIDFGTSNSAAAVNIDGRPRRVPIEAGSDTLPTAVFFPMDGRGMQIGAAASEALISREEGRYMRALKSVLGTSLFHESRMIGGKRRTLADIVTAFLIAVKQRAEAQTGQTYSTVLSGRPVHFHTSDTVRDARAEADLRACYLAAGFEDVSFLLEPEAAALASHGLKEQGGIGLIVDIGGGTSDFSVFKTESGKVEILASHGIRLGGTDFDHVVSMAHAMPHLGYGGELRREFGPGLLPVPKAVYVDLSTWQKIPFLYNRETRRLVADMAKLAVSPKEMHRLETVLDLEFGHELAFAVEHGKIAANGDATDTVIDMSYLEPGLGAPISPASLDASLGRFRDQLRAAAAETLRLANTRPEDVATVILVGGSSLMGMVTSELRALCPSAEQKYSEAFTAVVDGLAIAAADAF